MEQPLENYAWDLMVTPAVKIAELMTNIEPWERPPTKPSIYRTMRSEIDSQFWKYPINAHLGQKYRMQRVEILKANWDILSLLEWQIHPRVKLIAGGMDYDSGKERQAYPLYYMSLLYRTDYCSSETVWESVRQFLSHLSTGDDDWKPQVVYLKPQPVSEDEGLSHLKLLKYLPSKITKEELVSKWTKEVGAYETRLPNNEGGFYYAINKEFYTPTKRSWDAKLPPQELFKSPKADSA